MDDSGGQNDTIAIVGIACQFPGARDPAELHDLVMAGRRMFRPTGTGPGGGTLFAALLDGWAPSAITGSQPDPGPLHKLVTETIALARADAGLRGEDRRGLRAGQVIASTAAGGWLPPGGGWRPPPGAAFDSLRAVAAACDALRAGDLDVAIAGGAELGVDPDWLASRAAAGELGSTQLRVYDAEPTGLLPGDGCGAVVLMRAADARTSGRAVYAEIAGWAVAPAGEPDWLLAAYAQAGAEPGDIALVEGHGAATASGDLAELTLLAALRRSASAVAAIGAASACIGHARAAAGAASLIKAVTALVTGTIPPGTGIRQPHPVIASGQARLRLPPATEPWPDGIRHTAVNSTDPAGAAVHLVLRREPDGGTRPGRRRRAAHAPPPADVSVAAGQIPAARLSADGAAQPDSTAGWVRAGESAAPELIFALCGAEPAMTARALDSLADSTAGLAGADLQDLARRLAVTAARDMDRNAPLRVAVTAATPWQLASLARCAAALLRDGHAAIPLTGQAAETGRTMVAEQGIWMSAAASGRIALVFPGLASTSGDHSAQLSASLGCLRMLGRLGIVARTAVGYSAGEIAGLVWAGCLMPAEAARLAALRGQVLRGCTQRQAAMVRVAAEAAIARGLQRDGLHFAAYETPRSYLLAGPAVSVRNLTVHAAATGIETEVLPAAVALHTPAAAPCAAPLRGVLAGIGFAPPGRPLISTVTGQLITGADDLAALLTAQLSRPVLFAQAMTAAADHADLIVVAGTDARLTELAAQASGRPAVALPGQLTPPATAVAALFAAGAIRDLMPFLQQRPQPRAESAAAPLPVPAMRDGEARLPSQTR